MKLLPLLFALALVGPFSHAANSTQSSLAWLHANQQPAGAIVDATYSEIHTAYASMAFAALEGPSASTQSSGVWLAGKLNDSSAWFYGAWGEADVPSLLLWGAVDSGHLSIVNATLVSSELYSMRNASSGGFKGYYDSVAGGAVDSGADTALAAIALGKASLLGGNATSAIAFIESLQNPDGSINLTSRESSNALYSLAPDSTSITALYVIASLYNGVNNSKTLAAAKFLAAANCSNANRSYALALSALALHKYGYFNEASSTAAMLSALQLPDGGFADSRRTLQSSNGLDSGAATLALALANASAYSSCSAPVVNYFTYSNPLSNGSQQPMVLSAVNTRNATASITMPNGTLSLTPLTFNEATGNFEGASGATQLLGTYILNVTLSSPLGVPFVHNASFTVNAAPATPIAYVGMVTQFPDGTESRECIAIAENSSAEAALRNSTLSSEWYSSSFGAGLTRISSTGCPASDPWCQCQAASLSTCCLLWNFWVINSTTGKWQFSPVGYSFHKLRQGDVFGNIWTNDNTRAPSPVAFSQICPSNAVNATSSTNASATDAPACNACSADSQCASKHCVHGTCRAASYYCSDSFCDLGESCSSCPSDCGSCSNAPITGGAPVATNAAATLAPTPSPTAKATPTPVSSPTPLYVIPSASTTPASVIDRTSDSIATAQKLAQDAYAAGASSAEMAAAEELMLQAVRLERKGDYAAAQAAVSKAIDEINKVSLKHASVGPTTTLASTSNNLAYAGGAILLVGITAFAYWRLKK